MKNILRKLKRGEKKLYPVMRQTKKETKTRKAVPQCDAMRVNRHPAVPDSPTKGKDQLLGPVYSKVVRPGEALRRCHQRGYLYAGLKLSQTFMSSHWKALVLNINKNMATFLLLRGRYKHSFRRKRVFRDRTKILESLDDVDLIERYCFSRQVIVDFINSVNPIVGRSMRRTYAVPTYTQVQKHFIL